MQKGKNKLKSALCILALLAILLSSYYIGNYGFLATAIVVLLLAPCLFAAVFPSEALDFYGKHMKLMITVTFITLPLTFTIPFAGMLGVVVLFQAPTMFFLSPVFVVIIVVNAILLTFHRILIHGIIKKEIYPESILGSISVSEKIYSCILSLLLFLILFVAVLNYTDLDYVLVYSSYPLAYVFWGYILGVPLAFRLTSSHKQVRLSLIVTNRILEDWEKEVSRKEQRRNFRKLKWFKTGLDAYKSYLSSQPNQPTLLNVERYYDATYSALLAGTKNDRKRILTSLRSMIQALGKTKSENNFNKFLRALLRILKTGPIKWEDIASSIKTESRIERVSRRYRPIIIYLVPILSLIVAIASEIL